MWHWKYDSFCGFLPISVFSTSGRLDALSCVGYKQGQTLINQSIHITYSSTQIDILHTVFMDMSWSMSA